MPSQAPARWRPRSPPCSSWSRNRRPTWPAHMERTARSARLFALELGLDGALLELVIRTARVHDVGKLAIPPWVLEKPGPLTHYERALMEAHSVIGQKILERKPALVRLGPLVRATHERWDGNGYPDRLKGSAIPLPSRIVAVCDAFDAMTHPRAYRGVGQPGHRARGAVPRCGHAIRPRRDRDVPVRFRRQTLTAVRMGRSVDTETRERNCGPPQGTTTPDGVLVQEAAAGSGVSYGALYDRYAPQVFNYCLRLTGSEEDASDATQEAFVNVLRRLQDDDRPVLEFSSYLFAAARHESYALMRQRARTHPSDSPPAERGRVADLDTDPERSVLLRDSQEAVREANATAAAAPSRGARAARGGGSLLRGDRRDDGDLGERRRPVDLARALEAPGGDDRRERWRPSSRPPRNASGRRSCSAGSRTASPWRRPTASG